MVQNLEEIENTLAGFHGTTRCYRYSPLFQKLLLTDGTRYLADVCECHWLFDAIGSYQSDKRVTEHPKLRELQFWRLDVQDSKGVLRCEWDSEKVVIKQKIPYTDFPLSTIRIWVAPTIVEDIWYQLAYLPSEH